MQKCEKHSLNLWQGRCPRCTAEGTASYKVSRIEIFLRTIPEYKDFGAYQLAYKVFRIAGGYREKK